MPKTRKSAKPSTQKSSSSRGKKGGSTGTVPYAAAGAVAGAAVGAAAAVMLKDEKTRAKVGSVVSEITHKAAQYADHAVETANQQASQLKDVKDEVIKTSKKSS